jgi:hypothetical protein
VKRYASLKTFQNHLPNQFKIKILSYCGNRGFQEWGCEFAWELRGLESVGRSLRSKCKWESAWKSKVLGMGARVCMGVKVSRNCRWESMQESKVPKVGVGVHMGVKGSLEWGWDPCGVNPTTLARSFYCSWEFVLCL